MYKLHAYLIENSDMLYHIRAAFSFLNQVDHPFHAHTHTHPHTHTHHTHTHTHTHRSRGLRWMAVVLCWIWSWVHWRRLQNKATWRWWNCWWRRELTSTSPTWYSHCCTHTVQVCTWFIEGCRIPIDVTNWKTVYSLKAIALPYKL